MIIKVLGHGRRRYGTLLIDPPWPYRQKLGRGKRAGDTTRGGLPYHTMTLEDIAALPIQKIAAKDCMLWLWTTNAHLHDAFHMLDVWGFEYKTVRTWFKRKIGLGFWLRGQTEQCLLAVRGSPRQLMRGLHGASGHALSTALIQRAGKQLPHSKKPPEQYEDIERISPAPRLELFAREEHDGWDAWGDELRPGSMKKVSGLFSE
ncbi:hypothetical protein LCGC14_1652800 [marine sediment metagenome]|uniref:MT-A70 family protein n=1 Tax=marine sediment metagenome TaxID=412755 RepID=A0A0F9KWN2_9ZZZZ